MRGLSVWAVALWCVSGAASVLADVPEGLVYDDAFTFYEIENHETHEDGRAVDEGWELKGHFRVFGAVAPRSSFKMVIKQGRRTLGETVCEGSLVNQHNTTADGPVAFQTTNCRDRSQRVTQTGDVTVDVILVDDNTDEEHLLRTHSLKVLTATRVRGNGDPDSPHHYVDRNSEVLGSILHLQPNRGDPYFGPVGGRNLDTFDGTNVVTVTMNAHPDRDHWRVSSQTHLRCKVNGERIEIQRDQVTGTQVRMVYVVHSHDRGRRDEREDVGFRQYVIRLPLSFRSTMVAQTHERWYPLAEERLDQSLTYLDQHPGSWECQWRAGRDVLRTWRWTVGDDGHVQPHPEQANGLTFGPNAYLVETEIPSDSGHDVRLHRRSVQRGAWYGRGWSTDEGRAMAGAVPNVGEPSPPQPRARRRRRR